MKLPAETQAFIDHKRYSLKLVISSGQSWIGQLRKLYFPSLSTIPFQPLPFHTLPTIPLEVCPLHTTRDLL